MTERPFGVNIFFPARLAVDEAAIERYAERLEVEAARYGVACGEPTWSDDEWEAKLALVARERPAVVSFAFGCPDAADRLLVARRRHRRLVHRDVARPKRRSPRRQASTRSSCRERRRADTRARSRIQTMRRSGCCRSCSSFGRSTDVPLIAAGGIATGRGVAAVLAAGASAAQIGSALMLTPEAGTSDAQRVAFGEDMPTALTRAFTGRRARGIVNRFMRDHDAAAPKGYPQVHNLTAPLRAAARAAGDSGRDQPVGGTGIPARASRAGRRARRALGRRGASGASAMSRRGGDRPAAVESPHDGAATPARSRLRARPRSSRLRR